MAVSDFCMLKKCRTGLVLVAEDRCPHPKVWCDCECHGEDDDLDDEVEESPMEHVHAMAAASRDGTLDVDLDPARARDEAAELEMTSDPWRARADNIARGEVPCDDPTCPRTFRPGPGKKSHMRARHPDLTVVVAPAEVTPERVPCRDGCGHPPFANRIGEGVHYARMHGPNAGSRDASPSARDEERPDRVVSVDRNLTGLPVGEPSAADVTHSPPQRVATGFANETIARVRQLLDDALRESYTDEQRQLVEMLRQIDEILAT